ncbi:MAG: radical SAM protein [Candidatus Sumerlaeia bacterium]|nr:radical SAM protein [Candidatus Sumerlaeia bacterium]
MLSRPAALRNTVLTAIDKLGRRSRTLSRPLKIHLEVNDVCNLKCIHCPREDPTIPKNTGHMKMEVIEALRPSFRTAAYVGLIGNGEPFMHPRLLDIVDIVAAEGAVPSIISNATLWTDAKLDRLIAAGKSIMNISFDGGTKETFEWVRRPAVFEDVVANMRRLRARREAAKSPFPVTAMISCLFKEALHEAPKVVEIAAGCGVQMIHFQCAIPYAQAFQASVFTPEDRPRVEEALALARARGAELGVRVHFHSQWDGERPRLNGGGVLCPNIMEQLHIDMHGRPRFCCYWGPEDLGNVVDTPVKTLWNQPKFQELRGRFKRGDVPGLCLSMPCPNLRPHSPREILGEAWRLAKEFLRD